MDRTKNSWINGLFLIIMLFIFAGCSSENLKATIKNLPVTPSAGTMAEDNSEITENIDSINDSVIF